MTFVYDSAVFVAGEEDIKAFDIEPENVYKIYQSEDPEIFEKRYQSLWPPYGENPAEWSKMQNNFIALLLELGERPAVRCMDNFAATRTRESQLFRSTTDCGTITGLLQTKLEKT
eukprot:UN31432